MNKTHAVLKTTRKNDRACIVFTGDLQDCVQFCVDKNYPEEFCDPEYGEYGDEEEHLEIVNL